MIPIFRQFLKSSFIFLIIFFSLKMQIFLDMSNARYIIFFSAIDYLIHGDPSNPI